MKREQLSPTILSCYVKDATWFVKYSQGSLYDPEGYNAQGYNAQGQDRAGNTTWNYSHRPAFDEDDQPYDAGWESFHTVAQEWCAYNVDKQLSIPAQMIGISKKDQNVYHIDDLMCQFNGDIVYSNIERSQMLQTSLSEIVQGHQPQLFLNI